MKSAEFGSRGGGMSGVLDQKRHSQDNILNSKTVNNKSSSTYDSRSSTPSSNSNSLTKKKKTNVVDEVLDDSSITNTSPYFHLTKNGKYIASHFILYFNHVGNYVNNNLSSLFLNFFSC